MSEKKNIFGTMTTEATSKVSKAAAKTTAATAAATKKAIDKFFGQMGACAVGSLDCCEHTEVDRKINRSVELSRRLKSRAEILDATVSHEVRESRDRALLAVIKIARNFSYPFEVSSALMTFLEETPEVYYVGCRSGNGGYTLRFRHPSQAGACDITLQRNRIEANSSNGGFAVITITNSGHLTRVAHLEWGDNKEFWEPILKKMGFRDEEVI